MIDLADGWWWWLVLVGSMVFSILAAIAEKLGGWISESPLGVGGFVFCSVVIFYVIWGAGEWYLSVSRGKEN